MQHILLWAALFLALGFEFINGFHDTANAVATVIYTKTLRPLWAVLWSGMWNFAGALTSTGAVAYGIINLLPPDLMDSHSISGVSGDLFLPDFGDHLESVDLVVWPSNFVQSHADRIDHGGWHRCLADPAT